DCDVKQKIIRIDLARHKNRREIRSTMLHEMAHAGVGVPHGHGLRFFAQVERLLQHGAPIEVGTPETGRAEILAGIVPPRFRLMRQMIERAERRRARAVESRTAEENLPTEIVREESILL